ncbi:hypothetical protein HAX54_011608, partial [Datura stramonium]|nr:hypothetical protein [Datura stramonium]
MTRGPERRYKPHILKPEYDSLQVLKIKEVQSICKPHLPNRGCIPVQLGRFYSQLVREFYASYGAAQRHQKATGTLRYRTCLESVRIIGVQVDYTLKVISMSYFGDDDANAREYPTKLENPKNNYTW